MVSLNELGQIVIHTSAEELDVDDAIFDKYIESMNDINFAVEKGGAYFDENFNVQIRSQEEVTEFVWAKDQQEANSGFIEPFNSPMLYAYDKALQNKNELDEFFWAIAGNPFGNPSGAYPATVGYWVAKIREGGAWDYKIVPGYAPYDKLWYTYTKSTQTYRTSEWFGNYNYGFTGRYLFSLSILLAGGDFAAGHYWGNPPDSPGDKAAVTFRFNDW